MTHTHHKPDGTFSGLVSGPVTPLLTTAEAKAHLRVDFADDDTLIGAYVQAATDMVDAEWGELGRALITQRWKLTMPSLGGSRIVLPVPPVQQVTHFQYYDADNVQQDLDVNAYRLTVNGEEAYLDLVDGYSWPATYDRADAVQIQYDTGHGDAATDVPEGIRQAVRLMVSHWYETRSAAVEKSLDEMPLGVRMLLHKYRVTRGFI